MISLNGDAQMMVAIAQQTRAANKVEVIKLLVRCNEALNSYEIDKAQDHAELALKLAAESVHHAFLSVDGQIALVANERKDCENHQKLDAIEKAIYQILCGLYRVKPKPAKTNLVNIDTHILSREIKNIINLLVETN